MLISIAPDPEAVDAFIQHFRLIWPSCNTYKVVISINILVWHTSCKAWPGLLTMLASPSAMHQQTASKQGPPAAALSACHATCDLHQPGLSPTSMLDTRQQLTQLQMSTHYHPHPPSCCHLAVNFIHNQKGKGAHS